MTIVADSHGVVLGKFTIPADIPYGTKNVAFQGAGGTVASASFFGEGLTLTDTRTVVNQITTTLWRFYGQSSYDPIAQTFTLNAPYQAHGLDLFFTVAPTTTVSVQIRETLAGFPTQTVLTDCRLDPSDIVVGDYTHFVFDNPATLDAGVEYAFVVLCNDSNGELAIAELGQFDAANQQWVTSQPYTVGVLLNSSNASTWTAFQDRDLCFRLLGRQYTESSHLVDLGTVTLTSATDLLLTTLMDTPDSGSTGQLQITLPDGTVMTAGDGQHIQFGTAISGTVGVKALLRADTNFSAALYPGTEIIQGVVRSSGTYITDAINADATGVTVKIIYDAIIPSGANVVPQVQGIGSSSWVSMTAVGLPVAINLDEGLYEYTYQVTGVDYALVRALLTLTGTPGARPIVSNLRVIVM